MSVFATYLRDTEDAAGVLETLASRYPNSKSTYITDIRKAFLTFDLYHPKYREEMDLVLRTIDDVMGRCRSADKRRELSEARAKVVQFDSMSALEKFGALKKVRASNYSGAAMVDGLLQKIHLFPDCYSALRLSEKEKEKCLAKATVSLIEKSRNSYGVDAGELLAAVRSAFSSSKKNMFQLACALSLCSGRRMIEIFKLGSFERYDRTERGALFRGQAKKGGGKYEESYPIPLLTTYDEFMENLTALREAKPCEGMENSEVNMKYSNSCNSAVKKFLKGQAHKFHDLRMIYGVMCYHMALPHTWSLNYFISSILGHSNMQQSLHYSCIHVTNCPSEPWPPCSSS